MPGDDLWQDAADVTGNTVMVLLQVHASYQKQHGVAVRGVQLCTRMKFMTVQHCSTAESCLYACLVPAERALSDGGLMS